jgi:hypothetical protein
MRLLQLLNDPSRPSMQPSRSPHIPSRKTVISIWYDVAPDSFIVNRDFVISYVVLKRVVPASLQQRQPKRSAPAIRSAPR